MAAPVIEKPVVVDKKASPEPAGILAEMAREISGSVPGAKVELITGEEISSMRGGKVSAQVAEMEPEQLVIPLGKITFQPSQGTLSLEQRRDLRNALGVIDSNDVARLELAVTGGREGGRMTQARVEDISGEIEQVLGKAPTVHLIPASQGDSLHVLTSNLYVTTTEDELEAPHSETAPASGEARASSHGGIRNLIPNLFKSTAATPMISTANDGTLGLRLRKKGSEPGIDLRPDALEIGVGPLRGVGQGRVIADIALPFRIAQLNNVGDRGMQFDVEAGPYVKVPIGNQNVTSAYGEGTIPSVEGGIQVTAGTTLKGTERELRVFAGARLGADEEGVKGPGFIFGALLPLGRRK